MPAWSGPRSFADLLVGFRPCFTTPTFATFCAMVTGFLAQPGRRTVTGMLAGARLAGVWHHARAHRFFAAARWSADALGLALCDLIVGRPLAADAPLLLVTDDSLFKRCGRKVFGTSCTTTRPLLAARAPPGATAGRGRGAGALPFVPHRQVCLPLLARLWQPRQPGRAKLDLAVALGRLVCDRYPDRQVHLVGDAAYAGKTLRGLPEGGNRHDPAARRCRPVRAARTTTGRPARPTPGQG